VAGAYLPLSRVVIVRGPTGAKKRVRTCPICLVDSDPEVVQAGTDMPYGNFQRHVLRNHMTYMLDMWQSKLYLKLHFLGLSVDGCLGKYLSLYGILALAGQPLPGAFNPQDHKKYDGIIAPFIDIGWPDMRRPVVPVDRMCPICWEMPPAIVLHEIRVSNQASVSHGFCADCLSQMESRLVDTQRTLACPSCRMEVDRKEVVDLICKYTESLDPTPSTVGEVTVERMSAMMDDLIDNLGGEGDTPPEPLVLNAPPTPPRWIAHRPPPSRVNRRADRRRVNAPY